MSSGERNPSIESASCQEASDASAVAGAAPSSLLGSAANSKQRIDGKRCGVCGDRALGYNFNAITCESCKAFFRRNALKNKEYRCPFNDDCEVTAVTRRFCQRCRLRKCFEVGMKKEWIMTEEEKKKKRKKIQENRARKIGDFEVFSPSAIGGDEDSGEKERESGAKDASSQDGGEEIARPPPLSGSDIPLQSKDSAKPKAVVVGRVRTEEKEAKVRKHSLDCDVHDNRNSFTSLQLPFTSTQTSNLVTGEKFPGMSTIQLSTTFDDQCENSPPESLVAGLLRTHSQGSSQVEVPQTSSQIDLSINTVKNLPTLPIKREPTEEEPFDATFDEMNVQCNSPLTAELVSSSCLVKPCQPEFPPTQTFNTKTSEFSIQEALSFIQPGCKNNRSREELHSSGTSVMDSIVNTAISAEYSAFSLLTTSPSSELNQAETIKINELLEASKGLNSPLCEEPNYKDLPNPSLINVINLTEIAIRRLIKMAKKISAFKTFCQEDQIALLKGGCTEMMILRSVSAYDPDKDVWKIQQDHERFKDIKLKVLKAAPGNVYEAHKRFILSFQPEWRQDTQIIALLAAIALFTPERLNVIHSEAVRHEQCSYLYLLKRYLECKYGGCVGKTNYMKLLEIISDLHILNEDHVRVFLEVNPQDVEPLLIEIFDLKQS